MEDKIYEIIDKNNVDIPKFKYKKKKRFVFLLTPLITCCLVFIAYRIVTINLPHNSKSSNAIMPEVSSINLGETNDSHQVVSNLDAPSETGNSKEAQPQPPQDETNDADSSEKISTNEDSEDSNSIIVSICYCFLMLSQYFLLDCSNLLSWNS